MEEDGAWNLGLLSETCKVPNWWSSGREGQPNIADSAVVYPRCVRCVEGRPSHLEIQERTAQRMGISAGSDSLGCSRRMMSSLPKTLGACITRWSSLTRLISAGKDSEWAVLFLLLFNTFVQLQIAHS